MLNDRPDSRYLQPQTAGDLSISSTPPSEVYNSPGNFNLLLIRYELSGVVWISYDAKGRTFRAIVVKRRTESMNLPSLIW